MRCQTVSASKKNSYLYSHENDRTPNTSVNIKETGPYSSTQIRTS